MLYVYQPIFVVLVMISVLYMIHILQECTYNPTGHHDPVYDTFTFNVHFETLKAPQSNRKLTNSESESPDYIIFCIGYRVIVNGAWHEYWDCNNGRNYSIVVDDVTQTK